MNTVHLIFRRALTTVLVGFSLINSAVAFEGDLYASLGPNFVRNPDFAGVSRATSLGGGATVFLGGGAAALFLVGGVRGSSTQFNALFLESSPPDYDLIELSSGLRIASVTGRFRPYIGAGGVVVDATLQPTADEEYDDDDRSGGYYVEAGGLFRTSLKNLSLGFDVRAVRDTQLTLFGVPGDADSTSVAFVVGFGW